VRPVCPDLPLLKSFSDVPSSTIIVKGISCYRFELSHYVVVNHISEYRIVELFSAKDTEFAQCRFLRNCCRKEMHVSAKIKFAEITVLVMTIVCEWIIVTVHCDDSHDIAFIWILRDRICYAIRIPYQSCIWISWTFGTRNSKIEVAAMITYYLFWPIWIYRPLLWLYPVNRIYIRITSNIFLFLVITLLFPY